MKIQESAENYLEMILMLRERTGQVRSIDIVNEIGYTKASVSVAMKKLRKNCYINIDSEGYITLSDTGLEIATQMYERHRTLAQFLAALGVSEATALADACKIEHYLSNESYQCIKRHFEKHKGR